MRIDHADKQTKAVKVTRLSSRRSSAADRQSVDFCSATYGIHRNHQVRNANLKTLSLNMCLNLMCERDAVLEDMKVDFSRVSYTD